MCGGGYKIIAFEPDEENFNSLLRNHPEINAIKSGVWKEDGELIFSQDGSSSASFAEAGKTVDSYTEKTAIRIPVKCLDHVEECKNATFIKMDIEGSEYNAILGAQNIIRLNRPKLAICIYHSDEDMLRLIELIHGMVPEYHLYVRQHSNSVYETVLYAIC